MLSVLPIIFLSFSKHVFDVFMFFEFLACYVSVLVCSSMFFYIHFFMYFVLVAIFHNREKQTF